VRGGLSKIQDCDHLQPQDHGDGHRDEQPDKEDRKSSPYRFHLR
jgi:hypothetical protein